MDPLTRRTLPVTRADPYPRQLHHFARVIRGEEAPVIDVAEGTRTLGGHSGHRGIGQNRPSGAGWRHAAGA